MLCKVQPLVPVGILYVLNNNRSIQHCNWKLIGLMMEVEVVGSILLGFQDEVMFCLIQLE